MSPVLLVLLAAGIAAAGQFLFREGSLRATGLLPHPLTVVGMASYLLVMVLFGRAFRAGGSVASLYPVYASTFIFAALIGHFLQGTPLRLPQLAGMILLLGGIRLMSQP